MELPKIIKEVVDSFSKLSGVGEKTALRQVLQMTKWNEEDIYQFGLAVHNLTELSRCKNCNTFTDNDRCDICKDYKRSSSKLICVVENDMDMMAIERSGQFIGMYHILGGVLNPLMGIGPDELEISKLSDRIRKEDITEMILAINPSVEGDATCAYIKQIVPDNVVVERIGFGIPIGGSLEYLDGMTISKALENKQRL